MHNVAPSHALVRRSRQLLIMAFLVVAIGTFFGVIGLAMFILPLAPLANSGYNAISGVVFFGGVVIGLVGLALAVRAVTWRTENDLALITGNHLEQYFDKRYTFIRNISKLGLGYIDAVLVGPEGALVFRIIDEAGTFFVEKSQWMKQGKDNQWSPLRFNPTREAVDDIQHLRDYFSKRGVKDVPVYGVIVFTTDERASRFSAEKPKVPVAYLAELMERLDDNYMAKERIDAATVNAIIKTLYDD